jgi:putative RNA 2'-phosphotransferase
MLSPEDVRLSKTLAFILRHHPHYYELELAPGGWIGMADLLDALRRENQRFAAVTQADIERIINASDKQRYEIEGGRIRALYGHSVDAALAYTPGEPPTVLYHGTAAKVVPIIQNEGLKPMSRRYVHLSADEETARLVGQRKGGKLVLLYVAALQAHQNGIAFYYGNDDVWLADHVPPDYITTRPG